MKANGTRWGWQNPRFGTSGLQIRWDGGYALGGISLGLEAIDITQNRSLNVSNVVNIAAAIGGVFFWEVGLAYMALEAGSYLITGQSFGENLDNIIGKPIHSW